MFNMGPIASGITTQVITKKTLDVINEIMQEHPTDEEKVLFLLSEWLQAVGPQEKENKDCPIALQPYPYEYPIEDNWYGKSHVCIFFSDSTPIRFDIDGVGMYLKTVGPGWVRCDVSGRLSTTDANNHNVQVSYRQDALGVSL